MHLNAIGKALKSKTKAANQFTPALNNITGRYPKKDKTKVIIGNKAQPRAPKVFERGHPKYKPSDGTGVGY